MGESVMTEELQNALNDDAERFVADAGGHRLELVTAALAELRVRYQTAPIFGELR